jgi:hypothetical protein
VAIWLGHSSHGDNLAGSEGTNMSDIKPCPCGATPTKLYISGNYDGDKYAVVNGGCCGDWEIEFRTGYYPWHSDECQEYALQAWNAAKRAAQPPQEQDK